ncbi:hypothetical protein [Pseudonocardia sp. WMMC193]|uniref:hypothetical protein n=1 Tax=Pseudonocardia sp. WMMC193 TaxID=2911965 RepID=UPI001F378ACB|nr:hypothetical protein [Pseudonocardia sp. WMMC193]MCF7551006.1 hypothetical protein [Pseudonocardia sp. WMMC193]
MTSVDPQTYANPDVDSFVHSLRLTWSAAGQAVRHAVQEISPPLAEALRLLDQAARQVPPPPAPMRSWHSWRDREGDVWIPRVDGTWWLLSESAVPDLATLQDRYGPLWDVGPHGALPPPPAPRRESTTPDGQEI